MTIEPSLKCGVLSFYSGNFDCLQSQNGVDSKLVCVLCHAQPLPIAGVDICFFLTLVFVQVFQYDNEGFFGELALMYNTPR